MGGLNILRCKNFWDIHNNLSFIRKGLWVSCVLAWLRHGRELARMARQQSRRPSKFLSHFYGLKRNRRSVKFACKRSVSVYRGFPSRCTLNCNRIEPATKKKTKNAWVKLILTIGRRELQLKYKFCFVLQRSFADKFSVSWAFFLHEQCVSLRLPLSVLSDIIISQNKQFFSRGYAKHRNDYLLGDRLCKCVTHSDVNFWPRTWRVWVWVSCRPPKLRAAILVLVKYLKLWEVWILLLWWCIGHNSAASEVKELKSKSRSGIVFTQVY